MQNVFLLILGVLAVFSPTSLAKRRNWAVLIAGSSTYENYRHQANICHAYQILKKNGVPDEQIIVMMYDDIANNFYNPMKGYIFNNPYGPNVYPGVPKDYTGKEVNSDNFLKVLEGDDKGIEKVLGRKAKVLKSGPEDYVFVNFVDHGGPGILGMPNRPYLKARDLNKVLKKMASAKKFARLVFYVEACYSGSMFDGLLAKDTNIYVTTAANPCESSYACYWQKQLQAFLGDVYSVSWMENTDTVNIHKETLEQQYQKVKNRTDTSHVMQYGDKNFTFYAIDNFFANQTSTLETPFAFSPVPVTKIAGRMPSSEVAGLRSLKAMATSTEPFFAIRRRGIQKRLEAQYRLQAQTSQVLRNITIRVLGPSEDISWAMEQRSAIRNWDCYEKAVDTLFENCPRLEPSVNNFVLSQLFALVNLCNKPLVQVSDLFAAIENTAEVAPICNKLNWNE